MQQTEYLKQTTGLVLLTLAVIIVIIGIMSHVMCQDTHKDKFFAENLLPGIVDSTRLRTYL